MPLERPQEKEALVPKALPYGYAQGPTHSYYRTSLGVEEWKRRTTLTTLELVLLPLLVLGTTLLALLPSPTEPLFGETALLDSVQKYAAHTFFIPSHPPLVDLFYYALRGFPLASLRVVSVLIRAASVVLFHLVAKNAGCRPSTALFGTALFSVETAYLTLSRSLNGETHALFFLLGALYFLQRPCLLSAFISGVFISLAASLSFVGVWSLVFIGVYSLWCGYYALSDLEISGRQLLVRALVSVVSYGLLPLTTYLAVCTLHLYIANTSSPELVRMTPHFKSTLLNLEVEGTTAPLSFGSPVTIRHWATGAYLYTGDLFYPDSDQALVSGDFSQTEWILERKNEFPVLVPGRLAQIRDHSVIHLRHQDSGRLLSVADSRPPLSQHDYNNLVFTANTSAPDVNNNFKLSLYPQLPTKGVFTTRVESIEMTFQLNNLGTGCFLMAHNQPLAEGGLEVFCNNQPSLLNSLWYVERNLNEMVTEDEEAVQRVVFHSALWERLWELTYHMVHNFKPDETKEIEATLVLGTALDHQSRAVDGLKTASPTAKSNPFLPSDGRITYAMANLPTLGLGSGVLALFVVAKLIQGARLLNPYAQPRPSTQAKDTYVNALWLVVVGVVVHGYPLLQLLVVQVLDITLGDYLPVIGFLILALATTMEYVTSKNRIAGYLMMAVFLCLSAGFCARYSPVALGLGWSEDACEAGKVIPWAYDCLVYRPVEEL